MNFPQELKYTHEHEWVKVEGDTAFIGITDFAQRELGDIIFTEIEKPLGEVVPKEEPFGIVEAVKTVSDLFMPITGEILETNSVLSDNPELLNYAPYKVWIVRVKIENPEELDTLLDSEGYRKLIGDN
jgi:glycine cleavage system H protein